MKIRFAAAAVAALFAVAAPASAATLLSQSASTGITASPGSRTYQFTSGGGTGQVAFNLEGYLTLDGANSGGYEDLFTVTLNGTTLSSAYFNLGGSGNSLIVSGAAPTSITNNGFGSGGSAVYAINNVALASGTNTLTFAYASGIPQGTGDEGWGLNSLSVNGAAAVPEPATWAMMMLGFGGMGFALRRGRKPQQARIRFA